MPTPGTYSNTFAKLYLNGCFREFAIAPMTSGMGRVVAVPYNKLSSTNCKRSRWQIRAVCHALLLLGTYRYTSA
ncbi:hypothetical protein SAMN05428969_1953 [Devosia sp. YR412]|nr:hypothetical protein SAMN05428969_1953 [Devosia sp. YR412]